MEREKGVAIDGGSGSGKQELLGVKLRRGISVGKKGGPCTPVPTWKLEPGPSASETVDKSKPISARKLGANLWEIQDLLPLSKMSRRGARLRHFKDTNQLDLPDLSPLSPPDRPRSASSLRRHVTASLIQHKLVKRNGQALQPVSPASYSSSMEVSVYNQAITPSSSLDMKQRLGESGYGLKTSTELLKVLNRIWSLEEQHASNLSLVKALKVELERARARVRLMMQEQQSYRHEIDNLTKQVAEGKVIRKNKEQDRIKSEVQSMRDELEDERRLRRRSESLHRKLAKELSEVKSTFSKALKDLERERKAHGMLEDLCDEFAKGVQDYELEVRELKQKSEKGSDFRFDRLVLHVSEAWLDERLQMKLAEARGDQVEKNTIIDRLSCEIESFLHARRTNSSKNDIPYQKDGSLRRHSLESVHLNGAASAPQDFDDEDSIASDLHCFELNMEANGNESYDNFKPNAQKDAQKFEETRKSNFRNKNIGDSERVKGQNSSSSQVQFEEQMGRTKLCNGNMWELGERVQGINSLTDAETGAMEANQIEIVMSQKSENYQARDGDQEMKLQYDGTHGSSHLIENLSRNQLEISEGCKICPDNDHEEESCSHFLWRGHYVPVGGDNACDFHALPSPVQQWNHRHISPDLGVPECSSKSSLGVKENTLKAKLLEARLEGRHARLKASKGSSIGGVRQ